MAVLRAEVHILQLRFGRCCRASLEAPLPRGAVKRDLRAWQCVSPDTVYLGGGTPSAMDPDHLNRLLRALPGATGAKPPSKPRRARSPRRRIDAWRARGHQSRQPRRAVFRSSRNWRAPAASTPRKPSRMMSRMLRAHGIHNINIDLIAGLPGQTEASWAESLAATIASRRLRTFPSTCWKSTTTAGSAPKSCWAASATARAMCLRRPHRRLLRNGRRPPRRARHPSLRDFQLRAARRRVDAQSEVLEARSPTSASAPTRIPSMAASRWQNVESARDYVARSERGESLRSEQSTPDPGEEKFFVGLRLSEGVRADDEDWRALRPGLRTTSLPPAFWSAPTAICA